MNATGNIKFRSLDDLLLPQSTPQEGSEQVIQIPLDKLIAFRNHPFQVKDDMKMAALAENVKEHGVLVPGLVRTSGESYELIAGHRRKRASELAGLPEMPCIIREMDDDAATIIMTNSNMQRDEILPSEKAFSYKMKLEALKHQGARNDLTSERGVPRLEARDIVAKDGGEKSGMAVTRIIRLTELIPPLLELVDKNEIEIYPAAEYMAGLSKEWQEALWKLMQDKKVIPNSKQLKAIKAEADNGSLEAYRLEQIFCVEALKPERINAAKFKNYFAPGCTAQEMEKVILRLLEEWTNKKAV